MKLIAFSFFAFLLIGVSTAQTECHMYHRKNCDNNEGVAMRYDSQSKSAVMGKGQISEFHLVAYGELDYRISLCWEESLGNQIQFKVYQKNRVLIKPEEALEDETSYSEETISTEEQDTYADEIYSEYDENEGTNSQTINKPKFRMTKELLYDNATNSYSNTLEFTAENTMSLIIEVLVPGSEGTSKLKIRETGCVGVLISHVKSKKTGF